MWMFFVFITFIILIFNLTVKIEINEKTIDSYEKFKKIQYIVSIKLFNKVKIFSYKITQEKTGQNNTIIKRGYKEISRILSKILNTKKIEIERFRLNLKIGTENAILTSYMVSILSSIISILLARKLVNFSIEKYKYKIIPEYTDKNIFKLSINCIISIKLVHIIYMIYVLNRKDDEKYARTSNRRSYDNRYEQYKGYGRCKYNYR